MKARTLIRMLLPGFSFVFDGQGNPSNGLGYSSVAFRLAGESAHTSVVLIQGHRIFARDSENGRILLDNLFSPLACFVPDCYVGRRIWLGAPQASLTRQLNGDRGLVS